jgi:hypothetical protein
MTDSRRGRSNLTPVGPNIARIDAHDPVWNLPGYHIDNSKSWEPISASVFSRPAGLAHEGHLAEHRPVGVFHPTRGRGGLCRDQHRITPVGGQS